MPIGRPLKFKSPEEIWEKGLKYFSECREFKKPITVTGLCIALTTTRDVLMDYQDERGEEFSNTIKGLKLFCENYAEEQLYQGKNAAGPIFALKNFGWKDKTESDHNIKGNLTIERTIYGENKTPSQLPAEIISTAITPSD